jgi:glycosyltransferase involved in cell wall biosynthesis
MSAPDAARGRLLVLNQYYWPGFESTAQLLHELCVGLAESYDVTVVTGRLREVAERPGTTTVDGVTVVRVDSAIHDRGSLAGRGRNYLTYVVRAVAAGLRAERPDAVLCMTDPPFLGTAALAVARRFRVPLVVVSQDVFPEIAVELGRLTNPFAVGVLRRLVHFYLRRADQVVAIGETMRKRLEVKGTPRRRISVIANWVDTEAVRPLPTDNGWAVENGLDRAFVVMHSGNVGHAQGLETLIEAGATLTDVDDLAIVIVGAGARKAALEAQVERLGLSSVRFLGYQPRALLSETLSSGNVHVIGLGPGLAGYVVPSRAYGILAAGRPAIVAADEESETVELVRAAECGWTVPPGDVQALAGAIREAYARRHELDELGRRGREYVVANHDTTVALGHYRRLLARVVRPGDGRGSGRD